MSRPTAQDYALVDAHLDPNRSLAAHTAWDVRGCGAKAVMALRAALADAEDKNATLIRDLELACRDLAAVKLSRDAAEAKLADAEKHADELAKALERLRFDETPESCWCPIPCDDPPACRRARKLLAAHAARRAARDGQEGTR